MKKILSLSYFLLLISYFSFSQTVGIGTANPDSRAILDVRSTSKGILFPQLTTTQRNAISNPPNGMHIFNTDDH
ncbi:MAG: hypothetical protein ABJA37_01790, partial [Ferruginibacter sp.]